MRRGLPKLAIHKKIFKISDTNSFSEDELITKLNYYNHMRAMDAITLSKIESNIYAFCEKSMFSNLTIRGELHVHKNLLAVYVFLQWSTIVRTIVAYIVILKMVEHPINFVLCALISLVIPISVWYENRRIDAFAQSMARELR